MPKQKTHKGLLKRVKITAGGKVMRKKAFSGHLMSSKNGGRRRRLRKDVGMSATMAKRSLTALGR